MSLTEWPLPDRGCSHVMVCIYITSSPLADFTAPTVEQGRGGAVGTIDQTFLNANRTRGRWHWRRVGWGGTRERSLPATFVSQGATANRTRSPEIRGPAGPAPSRRAEQEAVVAAYEHDLPGTINAIGQAIFFSSIVVPCSGIY